MTRRWHLGQVQPLLLTAYRQPMYCKHSSHSLNSGTSGSGGAHLCAVLGALARCRCPPSALRAVAEVGSVLVEFDGGELSGTASK